MQGLFLLFNLKIMKFCRQPGNLFHRQDSKISKIYLIKMKQSYHPTIIGY